MKIRWWPHTTDTRTASYRLRCLRIIAQLRLEGVDAGILKKAEVPEVLVLSKRYDCRSLEVASEMRHVAGTRIVLDLCDNHFYAAPSDAHSQERAMRLRQALRLVDLAVASTEALAEVMRREVGDTVRIVVVGDAAEPPATRSIADRCAHPIAHSRLAALRRAIQRSRAPMGRRLVWFGHHGSGGPDGGMSALASLRTLLEAEARVAPIALTVVSNDRNAFMHEVAPWEMVTHYLPWHEATFSQALRLHQVAIVPIRRNAFTICKTNNRVATALLHGLAVAADQIGSYAPFADSAVLDDWSVGFTALMSSESLRRARVERGQRVIAENWSLPHIAALWRDALTSAQVSQ